MESGIRVNHVRFGEGTVTEVGNGHVRVAFDSVRGEKLFAYPEAFDHFMTTADAGFAEETRLALGTSRERRMSRQAEETLLAIRRCEVIYEEAREQKKKKTAASRRRTGFVKASEAGTGEKT